MGLVNIISISDIHLNHNKVPTDHIILNLRHYINNNHELLSKTDIIFIGGDVFDQSAYLHDTPVASIQLWMIDLINACYKYDILLYILNGTPYHDRNQSKQFQILHSALKSKCVLKYIDTLSIEYIEKFNINVLFIPDEWKGSTTETKEDVINLLKEKNLDKVDYTIIHGPFPHQLPYSSHDDPTHDPDFYLSITIKYIFGAHIHTPSVFDRILGQGSFDRLRHNEEHNKGFLYVESNSDNINNDKITFIVNENAAIFKSIDLTNIDKEKCEELLNDLISTIKVKTDFDYETPVFIRVIYEKNTECESVILSFKKSFNRINWTLESPKKNKDKIITKLIAYKPVIVNENSIISIVKDRLEKSNIDKKLITLALNEINKIKGLNT